jgi:hypothetical protein
MNAADAPLETARPVKRRLQVSLRTFLLLTALVAAGLALVIVPAREQQRLVKVVENVHGSVMYDYQRTKEGRFEPTMESPWPAWMMVGVGRDAFHSVVLLSLHNKAVTDETLKELSGLSSVELLHLGGTSITSEGLAALKAFPKLRVVTIHDDGFNDESLRRLGDLPALEKLIISSVPGLTDAGLEHLAKLQNLKWLWFHRTQTTEAGVEKLRKSLPNCRIQFLQ